MAKIIVDVKIPQELFEHLVSNLNEDIQAQKDTLEDLQRNLPDIDNFFKTQEEINNAIAGIKADAEKHQKLLELLLAQSDNVRLIKD
jgi:hypothetical protein